MTYRSCNHEGQSQDVVLKANATKPRRVVKRVVTVLELDLVIRDCKKVFVEQWIGSVPDEMLRKREHQLFHLRFDLALCLQSNFRAHQSQEPSTRLSIVVLNHLSFEVLVVWD